MSFQTCMWSIFTSSSNFIFVGCFLLLYIITLFKMCLQSQLKYSYNFIFSIHNVFWPLRAILSWNTTSIVLDGTSEGQLMFVPPEDG
jgi:hypothetical protein